MGTAGKFAKIIDLWADDNGFCTCGGRYFLASTMQGDHPTEGTWTQETYYCEGCETWLFVQYDAQGVEYTRWYEQPQAAKEAATK